MNVVMKKIYSLLKKSELSKFILHVKISSLIFSALSEEEMKNLQRSERALLFQSETCSQALLFGNLAKYCLLCYMYDLT